MANMKQGLRGRLPRRLPPRAALARARARPAAAARTAHVMQEARVSHSSTLRRTSDEGLQKRFVISW